MPHKHTRRKDGNDKDFNLPPTLKAKALPTFDQALKQKRKEDAKSKFQSKTSRKADPLIKSKTNAKADSSAKPARSRNNASTSTYNGDDTPREFMRLMQFASRPNNKRPLDLDDGLDRGKKGNKKQKTKASKLQTNSLLPKTDSTANPSPSSTLDPTPANTSEPSATVPKIMPGERLSDFNARVDQMMPVAGLVRKSNNKIAGLPAERTTKTEKRLKKMYAQWREDDAKIKERLEEKLDQEEEDEEELSTRYGKEFGGAEGMAGMHVHGFGESAKARRKRMIGEDDPWEELKKKRDRPKGLHDVVQAPPAMSVVPREKFKVRNGARVDVANVPTAAGSLKRREELGDARREVIERYRAMMKGGRL